MELEALLNQKTYPSLVLDDDVKNIKSLRENVDFASNLMFRHNLYKKSKKYILTLPGSPTFLGSLNSDNPLLSRIYSYLVEFDPENFDSPSREIMFFDHTVIENSNESSPTFRPGDLPTVRFTILELFNEYYKCDITTFNEHLNCFDDKTITQLEAIILDHKEQYNSLLTFKIFPYLDPFVNNNVERFNTFRSTVSKICKLHSFDENSVISLITKMKDLVINDEMRITFLVNHSAEKHSNRFELLFLPRSRDNFINLVQETLKNFNQVGLITTNQIQELDQWRLQKNATVSHFGIEFSDFNKIEPILYYGFTFNDVIDRPSEYIEKIQY